MSIFVNSSKGRLGVVKYDVKATLPPLVVCFFEGWDTLAEQCEEAHTAADVWVRSLYWSFKKGQKRKHYDCSVRQFALHMLYCCIWGLKGNGEKRPFRLQWAPMLPWQEHMMFCRGNGTSGGRLWRNYTAHWWDCLMSCCRGNQSW